MATSQPGPLTPEEFERVLRIKTDANQLFGAGESQRALDGWTAALQVYDGRLGSPEQRFEKGKLHSNKAEAALKLELFDVAVLFATESLECNPVDNKARFRRARALLGRGGFEDLMQMKEDVETIKKNGGTLGAAEAALLRTAKGPLLSAAGAAKGTSGSPRAAAPSGQAKTHTSTSGADAAREADAAPAAPAAPAPPPGGFAANSPAEAVAAAVKHAETVSRAAKAAADVVNAAHAAADSAKAAADDARDIGARPGAAHGTAATATAAAAVAAAAAAGNGRSAGAKTYLWNTDTNETSEHRPAADAGAGAAAAAAGSASLPGKGWSNEPCGKACSQGGNCSRCNPKPAPSPRREAVPDGPKGGGHPGWVALLPEASLRHGWLVDVYRTRVDDDARVAMGTHPEQRTVARLATRHGLGAARPSRLSVLSDFLLFCKLASARGVAPAGSWGWGATLEAAGWMLDKGFRPEQCGADLRYGPRAAGGALRQLASRVYEGSSGGGGGGGGGSGSDSGSAASDDEGDSSEGEASAKESPFLRGISLGGTQRRQRHAKDKGSRGARGGGGSGAKGDKLAEETGARIASACAGDDSTDDEGFARHSFTFEREPSIFDDVRKLVRSGLLAAPQLAALACRG